ncbi:tyrosine-protein phosphatase [Spirilliplanes yamanashiensis]|uniref:Protein-tyrosine-phosphatase n=1 Tax=Spirilliplanes yamanashiensis TaxID=42233 RepID=A0A8J3Y452_9ACTN|nr:tyrosine-protein phosphatase [Spirilliplanes yamanashiensis]MDP9819797.1 protein tyrosine/serine phosphatase [Spirilliplanes yamanashiensis]GIJ01383.1 protein-tyrosine-phosphatase [Spirilliplanes yamanashiensis]
MENPSRTIAFDALFNFRDLGGYPGLDGRTTRWRRVFRSDSLHGIADADAAAWAELGVKTVIDLRRTFEVTKFGRVPEAAGLDYRHTPIRHLDWGRVDYPEDTHHPRWLADRYLNFAEEGADGLATTLSLLADPDRAPAVVHCMAGKDRTGVVCALTLALVGVADDVIAEDYALSTAAMTALTEHLAKADPTPVTPRYFECPADAMQLFLDDLRTKHGSVEGYVRDIGVTEEQVAALRSHLLTADGEPAARR